VYVASFMRFSKREVVDRRLPLGNGGAVEVRGVEVLDNIRDRPRVLAWSATYRPAGAAGVEPIGDWEATKDGTAAYAWRDLLVVIPTTDYYERGIQRVFVRTTTGRWREIRLDFRDLSDGIDPPTLCSYKTSIDPGDLGRIRQARRSCRYSRVVCSTTTSSRRWVESSRFPRSTADAWPSRMGASWWSKA